MTIKSTQNLQIQKICDEEVADKANYDAGTKYSFYLSFQVKEKDGTIKTYTNQTMLSYYKKKNKSQNYSINFASEEDCRAAIAQYEKDVLGKGDKLVENSEYIFITMQPQVAMTIMDQSTGEVQAIVGGRGNKAETVPGTVQQRPAGSRDLLLKSLHAMRRHLMPGKNAGIRAG